MNKSHKATNEKYRDGWDKIKWEKEGKKDGKHKR